jgi:hypothetical protein
MMHKIGGRSKAMPSIRVETERGRALLATR